MLPTDLIPDPGSPRFAAIRTRLARAYLEHKTDLGMSVADAEIVYRVDEITILLIHGAGMAIRTKTRAGWNAINGLPRSWMI